MMDGRYMIFSLSVCVCAREGEKLLQEEVCQLKRYTTDEEEIAHRSTVPPSFQLHTGKTENTAATTAEYEKEKRRISESSIRYNKLLLRKSVVPYYVCDMSYLVACYRNQLKSGNRNNGKHDAITTTVTWKANSAER
ncbi:hypothetical protein ACMFMF_005540 [Clarireedia jacksonii]